MSFQSQFKAVYRKLIQVLIINSNESINYPKFQTLATKILQEQNTKTVIVQDLVFFKYLYVEQSDPLPKSVF